MNQKKMFCVVLVTMALSMGILATDQVSWATDQDALDRMERLIKLQQNQIEAQAYDRIELTFSSR